MQLLYNCRFVQEALLFPKHFQQKFRQNKVYFSSEIFSGRNDRLQFQLKFRIFSFFCTRNKKVDRSRKRVENFLPCEWAKSRRWGFSFSKSSFNSNLRLKHRTISATKTTMTTSSWSSCDWCRDRVHVGGRPLRRSCCCCCCPCCWSHSSWRCYVTSPFHWFRLRLFSDFGSREQVRECACAWAHECVCDRDREREWAREKRLGVRMIVGFTVR